MFDAPSSPPDLPSRSGPPLLGASNTSPLIAPPTDPRPGPSTVGDSRPRPLTTPPVVGASGPPSSERPRSRTLLAFVAGATLAAGSFGLGAIVTDRSEPAAEVAVTAPQPVSEALTESGGTTIPVPAAPASTDPVAVVAAALSPSVVQVETDAGLGSGVVYADGLILTNNHVIESARQIAVRTADGRSFEAELLGADPRNDIAVLSVGTDSGLPVAALATDIDLSVGQLAVAIGSPFQLSQTVTAGIVSAVNRPVANRVGGFNAMLQTDAPINPGNSGGALADGSGRVIGINTSIRTDGTSNGNLGIGFAVPIDTAIGVADRITSGASLEAGVLGVVSANEVDNEVGVVIGEVVDGGAADAAGLVSGDRVISVDGAPVTNFGEVVGLVQSKFSGDVIDIAVVRGLEALTLTATLG